jgi:quercetin dioxygenase-like cupin family protein
MKIKQYAEIQPTHFESDAVKGTSGRVVIGKNDGADNFCMRVFEIAAGGNTPMHSHDWEHEMFIHTGEGELYGNGQWNPIKAGNAVYVPGNEEHQLKNTGKGTLTFLCLIPSYAPEL